MKGITMCMYVQIGELTIPTYGLMILLGVLTANAIAFFILKKYALDGNDFIILEAYTIFGGFLGAKILYLLVSFRDIQWNHIFEMEYFNQIMQGGFVFYGGLIGGIAFVFLAGKIHHIDSIKYVRSLIFLIPWIHCFGRIGCHLAGCCYGRPYNGMLSVTYPQNALAPSGISLFPVQLIEAGMLCLIAIVIFLLQIFVKLQCTIELYILLYSCLRFVLEYFRYDAARGKLFFFFTSQWISIILFVAVLGYISSRAWRKRDIERK